MNRIDYKRPNTKEFIRLSKMMPTSSCVTKRQRSALKSSSWHPILRIFVVSNTHKVQLPSLNKHCADQLTCINSRSKLAVLPALPLLLSKHVRIAGSGRLINLEFDATVRTKRQIMAVWFRDTDDSHRLHPISLFNLRMEHHSVTGMPVSRILITDLQTKPTTIL